MERKSKILIGETSLFAQDCARALQNLGCLVTLCEKNGNSIISALSGAYYDAVVAELFMPGADGSDVLEHISQFDEKPIALILLNSDDYKLQQQAMSAGADYCLVCPADPNSVAKRIMRLLMWKKSRVQPAVNSQRLSLFAHRHCNVRRRSANDRRCYKAALSGCCKNVFQHTVTR